MQNAGTYTLIGGAALAVGVGLGLLVARSTPDAEQTPPANTPVNAVSDGPTDDGADNPYAAFRLADFTLTDHTGASAGPSRFDGEVTALVFFFTSCQGPCPRLIGSMVQIDQRTSGAGPEAGLRFAAISVDGTHDTPEVLSAYAERMGLDEDRWSLLTGDPALVSRLARDSLSYEIRNEEGVFVRGPDGQEIASILHPTRIMLVGPDRRLIGTYAYTDSNDIGRLITDARAALSG